MFLENSQIADSVFDELRSDQRPTGMPLLAVRREDTVSKKVFPIVVERLAFSIVFELRCQDGLDVLWLSGEEEALRTDLRFNRIWGCGRSEIREEPLPELKVLVPDGRDDASIGEVEA